IIELLVSFSIPKFAQRSLQMVANFGIGTLDVACYHGGAMNHDGYDDGYIRGILNTVKTIAMVGVSAKDSRPSYFAFKYLLARGSRRSPGTPGLAGQELLGQKVYARLADIPEPVDMVDIFRASPYALGIVEEALKMQPRPRVVWMQLGIRNDEAAALAE